MDITNSTKQLALGQFLLRLSVGTLILSHGISNTASNFTGVKTILQANHLPDFLSYGVFIGEVLAPVLIILGFRARLGAILLTVNMGAAMVLAHRSDVFGFNAYGGWNLELQGLYFFGALVIACIGAGTFALSHKKHWD